MKNKYLDGDGVEQIQEAAGDARQGFSGSSAHVTAMGQNGLLQGTGTYSATAILGYKILAQGSGAWSITFAGGSAISIPFDAMILGGQVAEELESITVPTGGSVLLYIPVD